MLDARLTTPEETRLATWVAPFTTRRQPPHRTTFNQQELACDSAFPRQRGEHQQRHAAAAPAWGTQLRRNAEYEVTEQPDHVELPIPAEQIEAASQHELEALPGRYGIPIIGAR